MFPSLVSIKDVGKSNVSPVQDSPLHLCMCGFRYLENKFLNLFSSKNVLNYTSKYDSDDSELSTVEKLFLRQFQP